LIYKEYFIKRDSADYIFESGRMTMPGLAEVHQPVRFKAARR